MKQGRQKYEQTKWYDNYANDQINLKSTMRTRNVPYSYRETYKRQRKKKYMTHTINGFLLNCIIGLKELSGAYE